MSSTYRKPLALSYGLKVFQTQLEGKCIEWFVDNYAASVIVQKGSGKMHLHNLALHIFELSQSFALKVTWIPRELNTVADLLSKYVDVDDWEVADRVFSELNSEWGSFTVDRFANANNKTQVPRFYSRFYELGSEGTDAFNYSCMDENNWLVPPGADISRVLLKCHREPFQWVLFVP